MFMLYVVYSHNQAFTGCITSILHFIRSSNEDFRVLRHISTDCTAFSTIPFDPLLPFGAISAIVLAPVLAVHTSSTKNLMAFSWSVFNMMSRFSSPHSLIKSITILVAKLPVEPLLGTATAFFIFVYLSTTTNTVMWFLSSPGKQ